MSQSEFLIIIFWLGCAFLVYTFVGYAVFIKGLALLFKRHPARVQPSIAPAVSVVLVAHNEQSRIVGRLSNLLASEYPPDKIEIIVVADGCTDATVEKVREMKDARIHLVIQPQRSGKAQGLNKGINAARGELLVFADSRQRFSADAISHLVANFSDPRVGAVSGNHTMDPAGSNIGGGVDLYWRLEKMIRYAESRVDSSVGCTGAIYAIRRTLFREIPADTLLDDVVIPMQVAEQGWRVVFEPQAQCWDPQPSEPARERLRKMRTLAGNFQMLFRYPHWLLPWKHRLWWQLISHKYLRIVAPLFLLAVFFSNAALVKIPAYRVLFAGQCTFYTLALAGAVFSSLKLRLFSIPAGFCFLNLMTIGGFWKYVCRSYQGGRW